MLVETTVENEAAMQALAAEVAATLTGGDVLLLTGELGSGKTTFVAGLARALGVTEPVTSPTFTIATEYLVPAGRFERLVHVDLYRLPEDAAGEDPAVREVVAPLRQGSAGQAQDTVTVIEWAERLGPDVPLSSERVRRLVFTHGEASTLRTVRVE